MSCLSNLINAAERVVNSQHPSYGHPTYDGILRLRVMVKMMRDELSDCFQADTHDTHPKLLEEESKDE